MNVLILGAGVIGTVYGAQLGTAGHGISVLAHGDRTHVIPARGLHARDVTSGVETHAPARVVPSAGAPDVDVVLVALRRDHLQSAAGALAEVTPDALLLFMGNNPAGRSGLPSGSGARVALGFPGVGGTISAGVATYYKIAQQPTAIEATTSRVSRSSQTPLPRAGCQSSALLTWMAGWPITQSSSPRSAPHCTAAGPTQTDSRTTERRSSSCALPSLTAFRSRTAVT